jgi:SNF2 family DNA or RNA helicase
MSIETDLPSETVRAETVRIMPGAQAVLDLIASGQFASPDAHRLRVQAERLALIAGFDVLVCLDTLDFKPFEYQVQAALVALRRFRGRGLLCDEVGLGKTIEAGLVLKEHMLRQMARRVLIITPPALVEQWREELASKFRLNDFVTSYDPAFRDLGANAWQAFPHVIASLATARRAEHRQAIAGLKYDLVIVDEAHHLKNRASVSWKFVNALQKKYILLLTATPVQNSLDELYNLITILKPGQLATPREFQRQFVVQGDPRLPKNRGRLRELLADVMVRHSRSQVDVQLPPRRAHTVRLAFSPEERALYDDVSDFVRQRLSTPGELSQTHKFTLQTLQREIGSCPAAAHPTLLALANNTAMAPYRADLHDLAERASAMQAWAKGNALDKLMASSALTNPEEKIILFTHFRATLALLAERLRGMNVDYVLYHGQMAIAEKNAAVHRFERQARVLLSTEAAGEGRNLQFCRTMVNVDLPWNPQRIEQRVGRIHRVGQTRPVEVFNLSAEGSLEDYMLDVLDRKLNMFELVIGEMDMILGHMADERDFEDIVMDLWASARTPDQVARNFEQLGDELVKARQAYQHTKEYDEALFGQDFAE